jgi:myo-inositol-1(or 4)-monophosphatase
VVLNPVTQEEFIATRGRGAQCNGRKIRVTDRDRPEGGIFASAGNYRQAAYPGHAAVIEALINNQGNYREPGSAALELACLAAGRIDGVWMHQLKLWDIAAGCLLVQEAGGLIGDFSGGLNHLKSGSLVAANPKLFKSLGGLVRTHLG